MKQLIVLLLGLVLGTNGLQAQSQVKGVVSDTQGAPIEQATVYDTHSKQGVVTDQQGRFSVDLPKGGHLLMVVRIGYKEKEVPLQLSADTSLLIQLEEELLRLNSVTILADGVQGRLRTQALSSSVVDKEYLRINNSSSLMKSLDKMPGVGAVEIGQGLSKPIIRGLGFNRIAVTENGIKQQGQQWGADHGLEIDQFNVERVEVVRGPMSLQYGSDAIGGVVSILPLRRLVSDGLQSSILLNAKSNNGLIGGSVASTYQRGAYHVQTRATIQSFGDYRVPADSFTYLGYNIPLYNGVLKNTAGRERNLFLGGGLSGKRISTSLQLSNVYAKSGFFAGAHGIPSVNNLQDDGNKRNIELPYQSVDHFKVISNSSLYLTGSQSLHLDLAYQHNHRREFSKPHSHGYGNVPQGNMELDLKLQTWSANAKWNYAVKEKNTFALGVNAEYQQNRIDGYSFFLPGFEQLIVGAFAINKYQASQRLSLTAGVRYDQALLRTHRYIDPIFGHDFQRSPELSLQLADVSFVAGAAYRASDWLNLKSNAGKSFRVPTANELGSNGVHHGTFRYELGDSTLKPETSYQYDASLEFKTISGGVLFNQLSLTLSGFLSYFPNFIFLNPTGEYDVQTPSGEHVALPDVGQIYRYQQAEAFRTGGEVLLVVDIRSWLRWESSLEYVYAVDTKKHYPLPFTPPLSVVNELSVLKQAMGRLCDKRLSITYRRAAAQNRVRNELKTPGYNLVDLSLAVHLPYGLNKKAVQAVLQVQNVFDTKYYNHLNFYRPLGLPEIGRNLSLSVSIAL